MAPERPGSADELYGGSVVLHANGPVFKQQLTVLTSDILKEGDGASKIFTEIKVGTTTEDDDLTPLSWLQDKNLLKGIALRAGPMCPGEGEAKGHHNLEEVEEIIINNNNMKGSSILSTSDDDSNERPESLSSNSVHYSSPSPPPAPLNEGIIPYNPRVHINSKPPYSFSCLIFMAIEDSIQRALPVKDIYTWILDHFPFYQTAPTGWKNSVRHNLSLNKCFKKVDKSPNVGKGSLWMVDPVFRPNLLQALRKVPYHPFIQLERTNLQEIIQPNGPTNNTGKINNTNAHNDYPTSAATAPTTGRNMPNPTLFPFLSRRLAAAGLGIPAPNPTPIATPVIRSVQAAYENIEDEDSDSREDVDAATAMLALKHGPRILPTRDELYKRFRESNQYDGKLRNRSTVITSPENIYKTFVITSVPSEDHTYSAGQASPRESHSSSDEAFGDGSASSSASSTPEKSLESGIGEEEDDDEEEEQRKIAEGADALLNLAGICTGTTPSRKRSNSSSIILPPQRSMKRPRLHQQTKIQTDSTQQQQQQLPPMWKKASLHQVSKNKNNKSKSNKHRR